MPITLPYSPTALLQLVLLCVWPDARQDGEWNGLHEEICPHSPEQIKRRSNRLKAWKKAAYLPPESL